MAIPTYAVLHRPILEFLSDGKPHDIKAMTLFMVERFQLSDADCKIMIPSGGQTLLFSRTSWAVTYLYQARCIERISKGVYQINTRGSELLKTSPVDITVKVLLQFSEFAEFVNKNNKTKIALSSHSDGSSDSETKSPQEVIAVANNALQAALADELLDQIKSMSPAFFERLIVKLMLRLGYGGSFENAGKTLGQSGDGGVDGVINEDKLGLEKIYLQAKRWNATSVGSPDLHKFIGALHGQGATKGVFITTSKFTKEAKDYVLGLKNFSISLVEGTELARLMIEHDLGVSLIERYEVKRMDSDFFSEE